MNENGKAFRFGLDLSIRIFLIALFLMPYYVFCGNSFPAWTSLELSENLFWFLQCCVVVGVIFCTACLGSFAIVLIVYYVQRVYFLCKLHKPERVYPPKNK